MRAVVVFAAFLVAIVAALAVALATAPFPAAGAPEPSRFLVLKDPDTAVALAIETHAGSRDAGAFSFTVPGTGSFLASGRAALRQASPASLVVSYDGPARFVAVSGATSDTTVRLTAQLDPGAGVGQATLHTAAGQLHIAARRPSDRGLEAAADRVGAALVAADWAAMFELLPAELRAGYTTATFASSAAAQTAALGPIVSVARVSLGTATISPLGETYAVGTFAVTRRTGAGDVAHAYEAFFILEPDGWRVWFTAAQ